LRSEVHKHRGFRWGLITFAVGSILSALVMREGGPHRFAWEMLTCGLDDNGHAVRPRPANLDEACLNLVIVHPTIATGLLVLVVLLATCLVVLQEAWGQWAHDRPVYRRTLLVAALFAGLAFLDLAWLVLLFIGFMLP
jgi:hypothetical protein